MARSFYAINLVRSRRTEQRMECEQRERAGKRATNRENERERKRKRGREKEIIEVFVAAY